MPVMEDVLAQLNDIPPGTAVSLVTDLAGYFSALKGVITFAHGKKNRVIYITSTIPSRVIHDQLAAEQVNTTDVHFIDCISYMVGTQASEETGTTLFVESPTMLEQIMLKVELWLKRLGKENLVVFLDSVNTLAMHNDEELIQEFLHYLLNSLRARGIRVVVLSVQGQTPEEIEAILKLVCDETITALEAG